MTKLDKQLEHQPKEVKFCKRCVVSNQRPRIFFDEEGICSACRYREYENNHVDWQARERELKTLLDIHRSKSGCYDCIVPSSGGKDSGYVASTLRDEYGMHPLCVTFAPFMRTEIGQKNFRAIVDAGFPHIEGHPNGALHRELARLCFETLGDAWQPFAYGQMAFPHQIANLISIPLIFYGECGEAQYSGAREVFNLKGMPLDMWTTQYHKGVAIEDLLSLLPLNKVYSNDDINFYRPPASHIMDNTSIQMHWLGYYKYWDPQENYYTSSTKTGFQPNPQRSEGTYSRYASLDDMTDGFHFYMAYIKFGIGRATSDAAHEVRDGHISRDEAVALVHRYDGEFPLTYFKEFLDYLDIDEEHFFSIVDAWRPEHLWERVSDTQHGWQLKHRVE